MCSKMTKQEICGRLRGSEHSVNTHSMSGCRDLPTSEQKPRSMDTHEPDIHSPDKIPHGSRENACLVRTTCDSSATCFLQPRYVQKPCVKSIPTTDNSSASDPRSPANTLSLLAGLRPEANCLQGPGKCHNSILSNSPSTEPTL